MIITILVLFLFSFVIFKGITYDDTDLVFNNYFRKENTVCIKGICCIIVIFIHIPDTYSNGVSSLVGSFAYLCVTLFLLISAYGVLYNIMNKQDYLNTFLKSRIIPILFPFLVSIIVKFLFGFNPFSGGVKYIYILISFYLLTFYLYRHTLNFIKVEYIMYFIITIYSLLGYIFNFGFSWYIESLGLLYGILLVKNIIPFKKKITNNYFFKVITIFILTIIIGLLYLKYKHVFFFGGYLLKVLLGIVAIILVLIIIYRVKIGNKFLQSLGGISFEIFLVHGLIIDLLQKIDQSSNYVHFKSGYFILLTVFISILFAFYFNRINKYFIYKIFSRKGGGNIYN